MKRQMTTMKIMIIGDGDKPMMDYIHIEISKEEWLNYPAEKRELIKQLLMEQFGYDLSVLDVATKELQEDEIYRQFYGDEE